MMRDAKVMEIKKALTDCGVKARVRLYRGEYQVYTVKHEISFTEEEQTTIKDIAERLGLTNIFGEKFSSRPVNPEIFYMALKGHPHAVVV